MERRMSERDDEDLAIEQLPATTSEDRATAGRAGDPALTTATALRHEPHQEHAATRAEPSPPDPPTSAERLRDVREDMRQLETQIKALPIAKLSRMESLDARILTLEDTREQLDHRLTALTAQQPQNPERAHLQVAHGICMKERENTHTHRTKLTRELGDPSEARAEHDSLQTALTQLTHEHTTLHDQLTTRELQAPSQWVKTTLGERPTKPRHQKPWEKAIRQATSYRATYNITDHNDPLGPRPKEREQRRDWQRAQNTIENAQQRLHRTPTQDLGVGL
jgi:hypothetical protein